MKTILFYSEDFNLCLSLLIYLKNKFNVITTTNFEMLPKIAKSTKPNLIFLDTDLDNKVEKFCEINEDIPVIITYVYKSSLKTLDSNIREKVSSVFYKPYDLEEISEKVYAILSS